MSWLADLTVDRTPFSDRGATVAAIVLWVVALAVMIRIGRHGLGGANRAPSQSGRGAALRVGQILVGVVIVALAARLAKPLLPRPVVPLGWSTIRPPNEATVLVLRGDVLWSGGRSGLTVVDRSTVEVVPTPDAVRGFRSVRDLLVLGDDLWIAHGGGVTVHSNLRTRTFAPVDGVPPGAATALCLDDSGAIWVGTRHGLARRIDDRWQPVPTDDEYALSTIDVLFCDGTGAIWAGSSSLAGGLCRYDGRDWRSFSTEDGLVHPAVSDLYETDDGTLWLATGFGSRGGVTRRLDGRFEPWRHENDMSGHKIRSIYQDNAGRMWIGSEFNGIAVHGASVSRVLSPKNGLAGWEVKDMLQDEAGVYWLATERGLTRMTSFDGNSIAAEAPQ